MTDGKIRPGFVLAHRTPILGAGAVRVPSPISASPPARIPPGPPRSAGFLLDLGLTSAALGDIDAACGALRQAVSMQPGLGRAWRALGDMLRLAGDRDGAAEALRRAGELDAEAAPCTGAARRAAPAPAPAPPGKIDLARRQLAQKLAAQPLPPAQYLRAVLAASPCDVAALCVLAELAARARHHPAAERLFERALDLAPSYPAARHEYAAILQAQGKNVEAIPHLEWLLEREPGHVQYRTLMAVSLGNVGDYTRALGFYEGLADGFGQKPKLVMQYAHALTYTGRREDAVAAYRRCIAQAPALGEAWWSLANLKNEAFRSDDLRAMSDALGMDTMPAPGRVSVHFALGLALEQRADYAESFAHYAKGAALKRSLTPYDAPAWSRDMRDTAAFFSPSRLAAMAGVGCPDPAPIFILGMPRAGSTLIEQILACHSAVEGTQELPEIGHIVRDMGHSLRASPVAGYTQRLAGMTEEDIAALGVRYMARSTAYRRTSRPFFVDKMPTNWAYAGLIHLILPNARIIDARRAPMASCFSAFKQLFGYGAEYSYDLGDLAQYYRDYTALMAHLDAVLPGRIHRVSYEALVEDTEAETRRLLAYCGLPFEPACLRFWENPRAVSTASSEQVRRPIFRDALAQWRHYEPWLGKLQAGLAAD